MDKNLKQILTILGVSIAAVVVYKKFIAKKPASTSSVIPAVQLTPPTSALTAPRPHNILTPVTTGGGSSSGGTGA